MPVFLEKELFIGTKLAVWHIEEKESFFLKKITLQRNIMHPHKRLQHLAGRYLLGYLFPEFPQEDILIAHSRKPYLEKDSYHFSISHSGNYAAAIVSKDQRTGIDVELFADKVLKVRDKFLNEKELNFVKEKNNVREITTLWSAKESVFKWWSYGGIDFSKNIVFKNYNFSSMGTIEATFKKQNVFAELKVSYELFKDFCLTYVVS